MPRLSAEQRMVLVNAYDRFTVPPLTWDVFPEITIEEPQRNTNEEQYEELKKTYPLYAWAFDKDVNYSMVYIQLDNVLNNTALLALTSIEDAQLTTDIQAGAIATFVYPLQLQVQYYTDPIEQVLIIPDIAVRALSAVIIFGVAPRSLPNVIGKKAYPYNEEELIKRKRLSAQDKSAVQELMGMLPEGSSYYTLIPRDLGLFLSLLKVRGFWSSTWAYIPVNESNHDLLTSLTEV